MSDDFDTEDHDDDWHFDHDDVEEAHAEERREDHEEFQDA